MATKKKASHLNLSTLETRVLNAYKKLREDLGRVPNNVEIVKESGYSINSVGNARKTLVKMHLVSPAPRGKTPAPKRDKAAAILELIGDQTMPGWRDRKSAPQSGPVKVDAHAELQPSPVSAPPLVEAANAILDQIIRLDAQRKKLHDALGALGVDLT
jgi:hypothetical protein